MLLSTLLFTSCVEYDRRLKIINNTSHAINVEWEADFNPTYPSINKTGYYLANPLFPNDTLDAVEDARDGWDRFFSNSKTGKLSIFIFNADTLKRYNSIDMLILNKMYKRLVFTKDQLEQIGWDVEITDEDKL